VVELYLLRTVYKPLEKTSSGYSAVTKRHPVVHLMIGDDHCVSYIS